MIRMITMVTAATAALYTATRSTAATVTYQVEFSATWSAASHPGAYPAGAHFSSLIGGIHNSQAHFWAPGVIASPGIEQMAETGGTSLLRGEIQGAINNGSAASIIAGGGASSPGSVLTTFDVSPEFPLVSLVTMVAPSPDWFVGVHDLDLRSGGGWAAQTTVDLSGYDAGSDNGVNFTSPDVDAAPKQAIALLGTPFAAGSPRLGTFAFTRITPTPEPASGIIQVTAALAIAHRRRRRTAEARVSS